MAGVKFTFPVLELPHYDNIFNSITLKGATTNKFLPLLFGEECRHHGESQNVLCKFLLL